MEKKLALFIDFENIARGIRQHHLEERVDLRAILTELEEKGRILVKRSYADWGYFKDYRSDLLQQGIEPVQVFAASRDREGWKNGADIRIAIDAIETAFRSPDITDFVIVSGDSDFLSLVNRLRENGKTVWGVGLKRSSSQYLVKSCDHYLFYEEIAEWLPETHPETNGHGRRDSRSLLLATVRRMADRQGLPGMPPPGTPLKAMAVKAAMRRLDPAWDERFEGYGSFVEFLQALGDAVLCGCPGGNSEHFVAERGTAAEANLLRMLESAEGKSEPTAAERGAPGETAFGAVSEPPPAPSNGHNGSANGIHPQSAGQRYMAALRIGRIRYVPVEQRYGIIRSLCGMFEEAIARGEGLTLKEAKDRLHEWYEENEPSVPWDHVNNVVYHLFWTYCFEFGEAEQDVPLWDRPTRWNGGMDCAEEIIRKCDTGLVRMVSDVVGVVDPQVALEVLGDQDAGRLSYFEEICGEVNTRFAGAERR